MYDNRLSSFNTMTAIIVEDDAVIRNSLSRILGLYFKRVIEAQDGEKALEFFESRDIHIAFLDIDIPLVNGLEVAAFMLEQEPDFPIIILTCHNDTEYLQTAIRLRLMDYLIKPINLSQLKEALRRTLNAMQKNQHTEIVLKSGARFNSSAGEVIYQDKNIQLTRNEKQFLDYMLQRRGQLVESPQICTKIGNNDELTMNALRNLIYRLRSKIGKESISAIKDIGYILL